MFFCSQRGDQQRRKWNKRVKGADGGKLSSGKVEFCSVCSTGRGKHQQCYLSTGDFFYFSWSDFWHFDQGAAPSLPRFCQRLPAFIPVPVGSCWEAGRGGSFPQHSLSTLWNDLHSPFATCLVLTALKMCILCSRWSAGELKGSSPLTHNRICLVSTVFQNGEHVNKSRKNVNAENGQAD